MRLAVGSLAAALALSIAQLVVAVPAAVSASGPNDAAPCGAFTGSDDLPAAPAGKVAMRTIWLDTACQVHVDPVQFVDPSALQSGPPGQGGVLASVSGQAAPGAGGAAPLTTYPGSAYAIERTWDCCGILLNELFSNLTFAGNGSIITSYDGWDGYILHREGGGLTGWSLNHSDSYLRVQAGGVGSTVVETEAHQGFSYQGVFDPTGTLYYNSYTEDLYGFVYGTWLCHYSYYWRHSFVGWSVQQFCNAGTTNG